MFLILIAFKFRWAVKNEIENYWIDRDFEEPQVIYIYGKGVESEKSKNELIALQERYDQFELFVGEHDGKYVDPLMHRVRCPSQSKETTGDIILCGPDNSYYGLTTAHLAMNENDGNKKLISKDLLSYHSETPSGDGLALYDYHEKEEVDKEEPFFKRCLQDTLVFKIRSCPSEQNNGKHTATILPIKTEKDIKDPLLYEVEVEINGKKGSIVPPIIKAALDWKHHLRIKLHNEEKL